MFFSLFREVRSPTRRTIIPDRIGGGSKKDKGGIGEAKPQTPGLTNTNIPRYNLGYHSIKK